jgi:hypothetical protein
MRLFYGREFETRSLARLLATTRRSFAFHVVDPLNSIHEFTEQSNK